MPAPPASTEAPAGEAHLLGHRQRLGRDDVEAGVGEARVEGEVALGGRAGTLRASRAVPRLNAVREKNTRGAVGSSSVRAPGRRGHLAPTP